MEEKQDEISIFHKNANQGLRFSFSDKSGGKVPEYVENSKTRNILLKVNQK